MKKNLACPHCNATLKDNSFQETIAYFCDLDTDKDGDPISAGINDAAGHDFGDSTYYCGECGAEFEEFIDLNAKTYTVTLTATTDHEVRASSEEEAVLEAIGDFNANKDYLSDDLLENVDFEVIE